MCRLAIGNDKILNKISKKDFQAIVDQLVKSMGGHGNGIFFIRKDELVVQKDITNTEKLVDELYNVKPRIWFFHTRRASQGSISYRNTHPIMINKTVLIQNGTWRDSDKFLPALILQDPAKWELTDSDTRVLCGLADRMTVDQFKKIAYDSGSVIAYWKEKKVHIICNGWGLYCYEDDGAYLYISEESHFETSAFYKVKDGTHIEFDGINDTVIEGGYEKNEKKSWKEAHLGSKYYGGYYGYRGYGEYGEKEKKNGKKGEHKQMGDGEEFEYFKRTLPDLGVAD